MDQGHGKASSIFTCYVTCISCHLPCAFQGQCVFVVMACQTFEINDLMMSRAYFGMAVSHQLSRVTVQGHEVSIFLKAKICLHTIGLTTVIFFLVQLYTYIHVCIFSLML